MINRYPLEVILQGEFTTIDVLLEGYEIPLVLSADGKYRKSYQSFEVTDLLNLNVLLKTWLGLSWELQLIVSVNGHKNTYIFKGKADNKSLVSFVREINLQTSLAEPQKEEINT